MNEFMIEMENVEKTFKVLNRREGIVGTIKDLFSRNYRYIKAVDNISLKVKKGEILGCLGPNGAGKSTTIKLMTGVLEPTNGNIVVNGRIPYEQRTQTAQEIGVVFGQRSQLWWSLPVIESFKILRKMYRIQDYTYKRNIELFESLVDIDKLYSKPLTSASLVMCSILIFAVATSFWIIQSHFILMFFNKFKDYSKYPVSIFNSLLKFIFTFIIPIGFIAYYPSLFFLQDKELSILTYLSPVFGVLFFLLAYKFWMMGARKYNGTGS